MTERDLAEKISNAYAQKIVDDVFGGVTVGGGQLAEGYFNRYLTDDFDEVYRNQMALRHWVSVAGYNVDGTFEVIMSNYIQNC